MGEQGDELLAKYFVAVFNQARADGAEFAVLSGLDGESLSFKSSDVDVLCRSASDVKKIFHIAMQTLKNNNYNRYITLVNIKTNKNGFQIVVCDSSFGLNCHMLDCFYKYTYENIEIYTGETYFTIASLGIDASGVFNIIKKHIKQSTRWPMVPQEVIAVRKRKVSLIEKIAFYYAKLLRLIFSAFKPRKGLWIALLGIDGAGKSILISSLRKEFDDERSLLPLYHFHWRPPLSLRRQPAKRKNSTYLPHTKPPRGTLLSVLKIAYLFIVYTLGYIINIRPLLVRGGIVLADRYYQDILVDPQRYRFGGPFSVARIAAKYIPKPDLFIILDLPPDIAHKRKPEVPVEEASKLRTRYLKLAETLHNSIVINADKGPQEVYSEVRKIIVDNLAQRVSRDIK